MACCGGGPIHWFCGRGRAVIERLDELLGPKLVAQLTAVLAAVCSLAGCPLHGDGNHAVVRDEPKVEAPLGEPVDCAVAGAVRLVPDCTLERAGGGLLVVRHPDGGFRRFVVTPDGRSLASADGAFGVQGVIAGGFYEIRVEGDAYRLPVAAPVETRLKD